ncbi:MAG: nuclear transport factor 2 family protein [Verrucomicrobiota bacterium]
MPNTPESLIKDYEAALASQQWERVAPLIDENAVFIFRDGTFRGIEAIADKFSSNFALIEDETYSISNLNWLSRTETTAACEYEFNWTGIILGKACSGGGRGSCVLEKKGGNWRILLEHLGPSPSE